MLHYLRKKENNLAIGAQQEEDSDCTLSCNYEEICKEYPKAYGRGLIGLVPKNPNYLKQKEGTQKNSKAQRYVDGLGRAQAGRVGWADQTTQLIGWAPTLTRSLYDARSQWGEDKGVLGGSDLLPGDYCVAHDRSRVTQSIGRSDGVDEDARHTAVESSAEVGVAWQSRWSG
ncbi:uncharacterized protein DS421_14g458660 [Arachis hypogaea]|nr:uncharacterized protein DS421_14g458660 [Arachis hypogaea]